MYEYYCKVLRVLDGDTLDVDVDLGFSTTLNKQRIRMYGIDTPESRTRDKEEKKYGLLAKKFVEEFMPVGTVVTLRTYKDAGKYGRYLGDFKVYDKWQCEELLKHHHAVEYLGQNKDLIRLAHLEKRKKIV